MALPSGHPWKNQAPYIENGYFLWGMFGASNTIGSQALSGTGQNQGNNTNFEKKVTHLDAIADYADPANNSGTSNYNLLNEDGQYGYAARISARLREKVRKKVCLVIGGESATPLAAGAGWYASRNGSDPFDATTRYGQMITRIQNAESLTGTKCKFIITNMAGRDAAINVLPSVWQSAYEDMVSDIRSDLGNSSLVFVNIGLSATPVVNMANYPAWTTIRAIQPNLEGTEGVYNIDVVNDLGYTLSEMQSDEVHYTTDGYNVLADAVYTELVAQGIIS